MLPAAVGRVGPRAPEAPKFRQMPVVDAVVDEIRREDFAREMRMSSRLRNSTDVGEPGYAMRVQQSEKGLRRVRGMTHR